MSSFDHLKHIDDNVSVSYPIGSASYTSYEAYDGMMCTDENNDLIFLKIPREHALRNQPNKKKLLAAIDELLKTQSTTTRGGNRQYFCDSHKPPKYVCTGLTANRGGKGLVEKKLKGIVSFCLFVYFYKYNSKLIFLICHTQNQ